MSLLSLVTLKLTTSLKLKQRTYAERPSSSEIILVSPSGIGYTTTEYVAGIETSH